jgi:hypothetical protein
MRHVTITEAQQLSKRIGWLLHWRPNTLLPENMQYAVVLEEGMPDEI